MILTLTCPNCGLEHKMKKSILDGRVRDRAHNPDWCGVCRVDGRAAVHNVDTTAFWKFVVEELGIHGSNRKVSF